MPRRSWCPGSGSGSVSESRDCIGHGSGARLGKCPGQGVRVRGRAPRARARHGPAHGHGKGHGHGHAHRNGHGPTGAADAVALDPRVVRALNPPRARGQRAIGGLCSAGAANPPRVRPPRAPLADRVRIPRPTRHPPRVPPARGGFGAPDGGRRTSARAAFCSARPIRSRSRSRAVRWGPEPGSGPRTDQRRRVRARGGARPRDSVRSPSGAGARRCAGADRFPRKSVWESREFSARQNPVTRHPEAIIAATTIPRIRVNERIRFSPVRLVDPDGQQLGIVPVEEARQAALDRGLDLVEVAPTARPPVCRIMDYGKFRYEQQKRDREARRRQHTVDIKQVQFRPKTDDHDFDFKIRNARRFLAAGKKVRATVRFRRGELRRPELGVRVLDHVAEALEEVARVESRSDSLESRQLVMMLAPKAA
ncbi:MAG TPA: translation initiation factor IF-3 [Longimicrobiales bacterium]|nr:translation initiation factor IF-3 [Longimicrobiales bacterium]